VKFDHHGVVFQVYRFYQNLTFESGNAFFPQLNASRALQSPPVLCLTNVLRICFSKAWLDRLAYAANFGTVVIGKPLYQKHIVWNNVQLFLLYCCADIISYNQAQVFELDVTFNVDTKLHCKKCVFIWFIFNYKWKKRVLIKQKVNAKYLFKVI